MGYTHYWTPKKVTSQKWDELLEEVKQLVKALPENTDTAGGYLSDKPLTIKGGVGNGKPKFTKKLIWFNGDEKLGLDHETFCIEPDKMDWNFCKTARKPYDLLVCATLLVAHNVLGYEVSSDGDLEDWKPAIDFYIDTLYSFDDDEQRNVIMESILPEFLREELVSK